MKPIYLEIDEEITSVIDKIRKAEKTEEVVLVFPKNAVITRSLVSLKLLKAQAEFLNKKINVLIPDDIGYNLAKRIGLNIALQTKGGEMKKEEFFESQKVPKEKNLPLKETKINKQTEDYGQPSNQKIKINRFKENNKKVSLLPRLNFKILLSILAIFGFLFYFLFFILPEARIKIIQKTELQNYDFEIVVDSKTDEVNLEKSILPGELEIKEIDIPKKKFNVVGEKEIGNKARGKITIFNKYSSEPQTLPKETKFKTGDKIFISLSDFEIPGAKIEGGKTKSGSVKVEVEAEKGGVEYNINSSVFSIVSLPSLKQSDIWGENKEKFSGGTSKKIKALSEDDIKKTREELVKEGAKIGEEEIKKSLPKEKMLIDGSSKAEVMLAKTDTKIDQEATSFEMGAKVRIKIIIFNKQDAEKAFFAYIEKKLGNEKFVVDKNIDKGISFKTKNFDQETGKLILGVEAQKAIAEKINLELEKQQFFGLNRGEIEKKFLENPQIKSVSVDFWPLWVKKVPKNEKKIKVFIGQD